MVFMDWRDSHLHSDPVLRQRGIDLPTFLYAMPLSPTCVFLGMPRVAAPSCSFDLVLYRPAALHVPPFAAAEAQCYDTSDSLCWPLP